MDRQPHPGIMVVHSGRNPHTVSLALGLVAISVYGIVFSTPSVSLDSGLTHWQRIGFGVLSVLGAALILWGIYRRDLLHGLLIERIGQITLAIAGLVYVIVLCTVSSFERSGLVTTIGCAITIGSTWRALRIHRRDLPYVRAWREGGHA